MDAFGWIAVAKIIVGVAVGSTVGTYISIQIARRIIQKNALEWISEITGEQTESAGLVKKFRSWAEGDFAEAVGKAVAEELEEKRREGSESNGEDR